MKRLIAMVFCMVASGAAWPSTTVKYVHTDALGSVVAVTDASGNAVERREYEPYGAQLTPVLQDGPGYTGHVQDVATGLVYMQQRYHDPVIGRFISVDPVSTISNAGPLFNRYRYAANNPYKFIDPDGRYECQGSSAACKLVDELVATIREALTNLTPGSDAHTRLSGVSQALGEKGEKGIMFRPENLGDNVFARAGRTGVIRIDTDKIQKGLSSYRAANTHMDSERVSNALGGRAIAHDVQHVIDYRNVNLGYPGNRLDQVALERRAYATQIGFDKGIGLNSDLWNPYQTPEQTIGRIEEMVSRSVSNVWDNP